MSEHSERVTVTDALAADCVEGECDHVDEDGYPENWENCPRLTVEVCVDCMEEAGHGRDEWYWAGLISHPAPPAPELESEPEIFKPAETTGEEQDRG